MKLLLHLEAGQTSFDTEMGEQGDRLKAATVTATRRLPRGAGKGVEVRVQADREQTRSGALLRPKAAALERPV
jgi:hypothetical protein